MLYVVIVVVVFLIDFFIKRYVDKNIKLNSNKKILKGNIIVTKVYNDGAMLGFLRKKQKTLYTVIGTMIVVLLCLILSPVYKKKVVKIALAVVVGGALNNFYDRVKNKHVVDYFSFKRLSSVIFNVSDIFIFIGVVIAAVYDFLK